MSDDDYLKNLVDDVRQEIVDKVNDPETEESDLSTDCQFCPDGLVIDGFCHNCGMDNDG